MLLRECIARSGCGTVETLGPFLAPVANPCNGQNIFELLDRVAEDISMVPACSENLSNRLAHSHVLLDPPSAPGRENLDVRVKYAVRRNIRRRDRPDLRPTMQPHVKLSCVWLAATPCPVPRAPCPVWRARDGERRCPLRGSRPSY
jgi:hypothetical protein